MLEAPTLELSYYADAVGVVPAKQRPIDNEGIDVGNGDVSPEWGLDLVVHGGVLRYGPWADRQRHVPRFYSTAKKVVLIWSGGFAELNCSAYFFRQRITTLSRRVAFCLVIIAFGLLCGYSLSFAAGQHYTSLSAKPRR